VQRKHQTLSVAPGWVCHINILLAIEVNGSGQERKPKWCLIVKANIPTEQMPEE
jgi:hypothetical protein